ncbi:MAG: hypothetical protein WC076_06310 [Terrimicrobiaceae bacterium]
MPAGGRLVFPIHPFIQTSIHPFRRPRRRGLVEAEERFSERFARPGDRAIRKAFERGIQSCGIHRLDLGFDNEPGDRVEIHPDDLATEPQRLDNRRAAAHERIENNLPVRIRIIRVVAVKLGHDVRAGRLERREQDGAEHAGCTPRKPFVHLVNRLERITLRHRQSVDLDNRKVFFDGAFHLVMNLCWNGVEFGWIENWVGSLP